MFANGLKSAASTFAVCLLGGMVALERQAHQQLRPAQAGPAAGSLVQCVFQVIGFGHEMPGARGGHPTGVLPLLVSDTPDIDTTPMRLLRHDELMFATDKPIVVAAANSLRSPETKTRSGSTSSSAEAR